MHFAADRPALPAEPARIAVGSRRIAAFYLTADCPALDTEAVVAAIGCSTAAALIFAIDPLTLDAETVVAAVGSGLAAGWAGRFTAARAPAFAAAAETPRWAHGARPSAADGAPRDFRHSLGLGRQQIELVPAALKTDESSDDRRKDRASRRTAGPHVPER